MKKGLIPVFVSLFSLGLVSAIGGSFNNFSLTGLFSEFNVSMYLTALLFVTLFAVIYFLVGRTPLSHNKAVSWIVSLCIASFSLWGILRTGFSFENLLYSLGFNSDTLTTLLWIVGILVCGFLIWKLRIKGFLATIFGLAGATLFILSILDIVYERGVGIMIGILFIVIALALMKSARRRREYDKLSLDKKEEYNRWKKQKKREELAKWGRAGRNIGYYGAKTVYAPIKAGKKVRGWFSKK